METNNNTNSKNNTLMNANYSNNQEMTAEEVSQYASHYSETGFWNKIKRSLKKAGEAVIRLALTLYYELNDPNISMADKAVIIGALGYFILPLDLIPDAIPVVGFTDDLAALTAAYQFVKDNITPEIEMKVEEKMREWFE